MTFSHPPRRRPQEQLAEKKAQVEDLQLQLAKREEELTQAMMKVDEEAAGKAQAQKAIREVESQLTEVRRAACGHATASHQRAFTDSFPRFA